MSCLCESGEFESSYKVGKRVVVLRTSAHRSCGQVHIDVSSNAAGHPRPPPLCQQQLTFTLNAAL